MSDVQIIAEAGVNHQGDIEKAMALVDAAAESGADIIKFQAFQSQYLVARGTSTAVYQEINTGMLDQLAMLEALELSVSELERLIEQCQTRKIEFLCSPFDHHMMDALVQMGMKRIKIASGELNNISALRRYAGYGLPIILSTGMANISEVHEAVDAIKKHGGTDITLLHCTSLYPAPMESVNLRAITTLREKFGIPVGYSDHTLGDRVAVAAVALGALVIEKHFTLDRSATGPDHLVSLEPKEFSIMISKLRATASALGNGIKVPTQEALEVAKLVRKSWQALIDLSKGTILTPDNISLKRPADGLPATQLPFGSRLKVERLAAQPIRKKDIAS